MKGLIITLVLLLGVFIFAVTSFPKIGTPYLNDIVQKEGTKEDMAAAYAADDKAFAAKYAPFLRKRYLLARVALVADDDFYVSMSSDTMDRYDASPLNTSPDYGYILFNRAALLETRIQPPSEAWRLYNRYVELFPDGPDTKTARSAAVKLTISHGFQ